MIPIKEEHHVSDELEAEAFLWPIWVCCLTERLRKRIVMTVRDSDSNDQWGHWISSIQLRQEGNRTQVIYQGTSLELSCLIFWSVESYSNFIKIRPWQIQILEKWWFSLFQQRKDTIQLRWWLRLRKHGICGGRQKLQLSTWTCDQV